MSSCEETCLCFLWPILLLQRYTRNSCDLFLDQICWTVNICKTRNPVQLGGGWLRLCWWQQFVILLSLELAWWLCAVREDQCRVNLFFRIKKNWSTFWKTKAFVQDTSDKYIDLLLWISTEWHGLRCRRLSSGCWKSGKSFPVYWLRKIGFCAIHPGARRCTRCGEYAGIFHTYLERFHNRLKSCKVCKSAPWVLKICTKPFMILHEPHTKRIHWIISI